MYYSSHVQHDPSRTRVVSVMTIVALLLNTWTLVITVYIFIGINFYLGLLLSRKVKKEIPGSIASGKFDRVTLCHVLIKVLDATYVIGVFYLIDLLVGWENVYFSRLVAGFIIGTELSYIMDYLANLYGLGRLLRILPKGDVDKRTSDGE